MIWATLVFLGIPIWLALGTLGGGLLNRHRFPLGPGVFLIRTRNLSTDEEKWSGKTHGVCVQNVSLSTKGNALVRTEPSRVDRAAGPFDAVGNGVGS